MWDTSAGSTGPPGGARRSLWTAMRELWPWCATHLSVYLTSMASSLWLLVALLCATSHLFIDVKAPMEQATLLEVAAAEAAKLPLLSALPGASEADATALGAAVAQGRAWCGHMLARGASWLLHCCLRWIARSSFGVL